ncbi:AzlC family ABC transporter permease [uncultured Negativibacillus sp.]|uniref:AzlC family ABC transporter permease n=1 Tax=uncultured Negativibacillus sp. TaxID=1980696 RepID=UPI0025FD03BE|nr:AzlC family ABC transporter permease [uncultured Negativibacillus sp.]
MTKSRHLAAIRAAFPLTVPVLCGYFFTGMAFGLLMYSGGYPWYWAALCSVCIYAGSMQFVAVNFFAGGFHLLQVALMTLAVNIRHMFYGISFIDRFAAMGKKKLYMIFSLTDETYSLLCSAKVPQGVDEHAFLFWIALLDQLYWIAGTLAGCIAGALIPFDTTGIDFAMTALFTVILVEQMEDKNNRLPALLGAAAALVGLLVFGADSFLIPSLLAATVLLLLCRSRLHKGGER